MSDLCFEPAHRLAALLRERRVSAVDLLALFQGRVARVNPRINAIVATNFEAAGARAREADAALARGETWGPLHGVPMTIKDTFEVVGMPTTSGSTQLKDYRPKTNAVAVQRLIDAGAIVFGKTNTPLFGGDIQTFNDVYGTTRNPWNPERTSGGSSGGAAAALAARLTPLELGSDIGGSIRTPAHFCGVLGHKTSSGIVPLRGHVPGPPGTISEPDLNVVGPLARTAEDLELALRLIVGPIPPASNGWRLELPIPRFARLSDCTVHAWLEDPAVPTDAAVRHALQAAVERLRAAGCTVTTGAPAGFALEPMFDAYFSLLSAVFAGGLPPKTYRRAAIAGALAHWLGRDKLGTMAGFLRRVSLSHREWIKLHEHRERLRLRFEEFFRTTHVLLLPVTPTAAPPHLQEGNLYQRRITVDGVARPYASQFGWISVATLAGLPSTSVPVGLTPEGLPVGMQVVGAHLHDLTTIAFAGQVAGLLGAIAPPPS